MPAKSPSLAVLGVLVLASAAVAGVADEKLGEAYTKAAPAEKLARLAVAQADKTLDFKDVRPEVEAVVTAVIAAGDTPEARLRLFGQLRAEAQASLEAMNVERKKQPGGRAASFVEPDNDTQLALALDYVAAVAGDRPTLAELACLKLVREATAWSSHTRLVLAYLQDALDRDAAFGGAELEARLTTIRDLAVDKQMMSDHERTVIENALVVEHVNASLGAGQPIADVRARLKGWSDRKLVCFFTKSLVDGILARLEQQRAARGGK